MLAGMSAMAGDRAAAGAPVILRPLDNKRRREVAEKRVEIHNQRKVGSPRVGFATNVGRLGRRDMGGLNVQRQVHLEPTGGLEGFEPCS